MKVLNIDRQYDVVLPSTTTYIAPVKQLKCVNFLICQNMWNRITLDKTHVNKIWFSNTKNNFF